LLQAAVRLDGTAKERGRALNAAPAPSTKRMSFDEADEIADGYDLVDDVVLDLRAGELIFDHYHQFETIKPVGPEIIEEARVIRDALSVYAQLLGNDVADPGGHAFVHSRFSLHETTSAHGGPRSLQMCHQSKAFRPAL